MSSTAPVGNGKSSIDWDQLERDVDDAARAAKDHALYGAIQVTTVASTAVARTLSGAAYLSARAFTRDEQSLFELTFPVAVAAGVPVAVSVGVPAVASAKGAEASIDGGASSAKGSIKVFKE